MSEGQRCTNCDNPPPHKAPTTIEVFVDDHEIGAYVTLNRTFCSTMCWQVWWSQDGVHSLLGQMDEVSSR